MARTRKIRSRIKAVRSIRRITRTMEMISRGRFKRTHDLAVGLRPYTDSLAELVGDLVHRGAVEELSHPLLAEPKGRCDVLMIITSNRGLCGPYNAQVLRLGLERMGQIVDAGLEVKLRVVGRRGAQQLRYRGMQFEETGADLGELPNYDQIAAMADALMDEFLSGKITGVEIAYTQFISSARRRPAIAQVLPLSNLPVSPRAPGAATRVPYEIVPSAAEILDKLLPAAVRLRVWQCFCDAAVSEQLERIAAMQAATTNADEMIRTLTVKYNRMRQSQITTELAEILGGRAGL